MQKALFLGLFLTSMAAMAAERSVTCGDHWFKVGADWTEGKTVGMVYFGGESNPSRSSTKATIAEANGTITVTFNDGTGGKLLVDKDENGTLIESLGDNERNLSPCRKN